MERQTVVKDAPQKTLSQNGLFEEDSLQLFLEEFFLI
jgi:hypothetical protein